MCLPIMRCMTYDDVINHFGTQVATADALGIYQSNVSDWKRNGVPPLRQLELEALTSGALKADASCDRFRIPSPARA
jgi:DNA-binding transcriptional regulator YdaS (Cro superfamily)